MRLSGGLSSTTEQCDGVTRLSVTCAVVVAEDMTAMVQAVCARVHDRLAQTGRRGLTVPSYEAAAKRVRYQVVEIDACRACPTGAAVQRC
jgi:hypothetical protein